MLLLVGEELADLELSSFELAGTFGLLNLGFEEPTEGLTDTEGVLTAEGFEEPPDGLLEVPSEGLDDELEEGREKELEEGREDEPEEGRDDPPLL